MFLDISCSKFRANPYPYFKQLRKKAPVCETYPQKCWGIFLYEDVQSVLKQDHLFSSVLSEHEYDETNPNFLLYERSLVGKDKPDHAQLRNRLSKCFLPGMIHKLTNPIETICQTLISKIPAGQPIDFAELISKPLPIMVLLNFLGIDIGNVADIKRWIEWLLSWRNLNDCDLWMADIKQLHALLNQIIDQKRQRPGHDLISSLLSTESAESPLTSGDMLGLLRLLLTAGTDTVSSLMNHSLIALAENPHLIEPLRCDNHLIDHFIDETLRHNSPTISLIRKAKQPTLIQQKPINPGDMILAFVASANHDEMIYDNPEQFDLYRKQNPHLGFGTGIHHCLGYHLGRLQVKILLRTLVHRYHSIQLTREKARTYIPTLIFRSLTALPVILD